MRIYTTPWTRGAVEKCFLMVLAPHQKGTSRFSTDSCFVRSFVTIRLLIGVLPTLRAWETACALAREYRPPKFFRYTRILFEVYFHSSFTILRKKKNFHLVFVFYCLSAKIFIHYRILLHQDYKFTVKHFFNGDFFYLKTV